MEQQAEPTGIPMGELIKWQYNRHDGGDQDTLVDQEQRGDGITRPHTVHALSTECTEISQY